MSSKEIDEISGTETTGHEWDGIKELNTPLPRWWLWTFYATIIWAIIFTIFYPAWPFIDGATKGVLGYSSRAELDQSIALASSEQADMIAKIAATDISDIVADPDLRRFADAAGKALFKVNCSQCHGSGAAGGIGYPNLNDDEWIWGGTPDAIYQTIAHGARFAADDETHINEMPAFGDGVLSPDEIKAVAGYVASLAGMETELPVTDAGKTLFEDNCVACHGEGGAGFPELGAPSLNNAIWLYVQTPEDIVAQISAPKHGTMPAWQAKLGDVAVKELAAYVHGLGGGQ